MIRIPATFFDGVRDNALLSLFDASVSFVSEYIGTVTITTLFFLS